MFEILVDNTVKEKNKKEWERINNLWLEVKNNHKSLNPDLYDTESDNSDDCSKPQKELKRADSSYDELLFAHDCIITEKNEIECDTPIYDGIEDSKTHFTSSSSSNDIDSYNDNDNDNDNDTENSYKITMSEIKTKYAIENSCILEVDYSMNYNMKMLTHLASYYNIIKNNNNGLGLTVSKGKDDKIKKMKKLLKPELIKEIILFETNYENHHVVLKFRKMLEKIDALKKDKYFSSFILFY
jgi:hypothetical protein